jgi:O-antigen ligase
VWSSEAKSAWWRWPTQTHGASVCAILHWWLRITAVSGTVLGFAGLLLSILNYFRDRPELVVALIWDMSVKEDPKYMTVSRMTGT